MVRGPQVIIELEAKESTSSSYESKLIGIIKASYVELCDSQRPYDLTDSGRTGMLPMELRGTQPLYELTDNSRTELPGTMSRIAFTC